MSFLAVWLLAWWPAPTAPQPRPELTPSQVVATIAAALRNYNSPIPNAGVFTAYCFASPANHAVTGPYGHFIGLVKSADFAPLLLELPAEQRPIAINGDHAEQIVTVHMDGGRNEEFRFSLSRQKEGRYRDCWMVDGVSREHLHRVSN